MKKIIAGVLFFAFGAGAVFAQADRPLRSVPPDIPPPVFASFSTDHENLNLLRESSLQQPLTQRYIARYTNPSGVIYLNAILERGSLYLPFIREEIRLRNLPPELAYLPVIESNFLSTARSRSGAMGLWQFMMNSISPFNIMVNDYVDERRDIMKATRGALRKLYGNHRTLGCWELALAAYNVGLGHTTRAVRRTGISDYWELSRRGDFPQETVHFVPKFLAAVYVISQPRRFGLNYWQQSIEWTSIPINRQISLDILAEEAGVDVNMLRRLNRELLLGITPPDPNYVLKVPVADLQKIKLALEREDLRLMRYHRHIVRHGDTLWSMSRHYDVTLAMIEQHNPGISSRHLRVGETVMIPALRDTIPPPPARPAAVRLDGLHVVQPGDTLWSLGRRYGIDPQVLAEENGMAFNEILRVGRTLRVPIIE